MTLDEYFDRIFCINIERAKERWPLVEEQCRHYGIKSLIRFRAYDFIDYKYHFSGMHNGVCGCTRSHGALLTLIAHSDWKRVLILEDDFMIRHGHFEQLFEQMIAMVPEDWDLLYLGGHYGEPPISRVNPCVIRCGLMLTTSSYAVTREHAKRMAPYFAGASQPDNLISKFAQYHNHYILQPRLIVQRPGQSMIWGKHMDYVDCMIETTHEQMV